MSKKIIEDKRISSRKRKIILRKWFAMLWIIIIIILFCAAIWGLNYFYNSSYFKIKNIDIKGSNYYKPEDIRESIKNLNGANIFEVDKKKYEDIIINNFTRIKEAELQKVFPDKLTINLVERLPFLVVLYNSSYFLIDNEGVVIEEVTENKEKYKDLLIVKDAINYMPVPGDIIAKKNVISSATIYNAFIEEIKVKIKYASISNNFSGDINFETIDDKIIIYGDSKEITKKNLVLEQILKDLKNENIYYSIIDLRISDNPVVK
ncbi:MAG TPA: FtsQ-type POTRA domain-containing protein [Candidatus Humimicrobiaceae bacterium]